jgi:Family of unknown function (DUF5906)
MSDDDNIIHSEPLFEAKYMGNRAQSQDKIESREDAFNWCQKYFAKTIVDSKFRIINEEDETNIFLMAKKDFIDAYEHMSILIIGEDKPKTVPVTELWLKHPLRRSYRGIIFDPSKKYDRNDEYFNTWRGFAIQPGIGDVARFLDYVKKIVVSNNEEHYEWLIDWVAHIFQKPWEKPSTSVVLRGVEGIGKSFFAETIGKLISGRKNNKRNHYYFKTSNPEHVMNHFNDHLANILLLHLEETFWAGDKKGAHLIKDFITGDELSIGQKHLSTRMALSYMRVIQNGNDNWLVPAGMESRRFAVFDVSDELRQNTEFYGEMSIWLDNNGLEALMHFFMTRNITHDVRIVPITEGLIEQRIHNMDSVQAWWLNILVAGRLPYVDNMGIDGVKVVNEVLFDHYCATMRKTMTRTRSTETDFALKLRALIPKVEKGKVVKGGKGRPDSLIKKCRVGGKGEQRMAFIIPPLSICKACMDFVLGSKYEWDDDGDGEWSRINDMADSIYM